MNCVTNFDLSDRSFGKLIVRGKVGAVHLEVLGLPSFLVPNRRADETVAKAFPSMFSKGRHRQQRRPNKASWQMSGHSQLGSHPLRWLIPPYWSFKSSVGRILSLRTFGGTPEGKLSVFCSFQTSIIDSQYKDAPLPLDGPALYLQKKGVRFDASRAPFNSDWRYNCSLKV